MMETHLTLHDIISFALCIVGCAIGACDGARDAVLSAFLICLSFNYAIRIARTIGV